MTENLIKRANEFIIENKHLVNQEFRQHYHMMPPIGWMNDPNGFSLYKEQYHLFYQHYPYKESWNEIYWGHAVSKDFINWEDVDVALAPDKEYDKAGCFSGTALVEGDLISLIYTCVHGKKGEEIQEQAMAYSTDGIHFEKFEENPVIKTEDLPDEIFPTDFRDPKIFKEGDQYYCMVMAKDKINGGRMLLYTSANKKNWSYVRDVLPFNPEFGIMLECPDYFILNGKAVLLMSVIDLKRQGYRFTNKQSSIYMIGSYNNIDGFVQEVLEEADMGFDFYAPQTVQTMDGRVVMTAWMQAWEESLPTQDLGHGWVGSMILPRELELKEDVIYQKPVREIEQYRADHMQYENVLVTNQQDCLTLNGLEGNSIELYLEADLTNADDFTIHLMKTKEEECILTYNKSLGTICFDRGKCGYEIISKGFEKEQFRKFELPLLENVLKARIFIDTCSIEIFLQDGMRTITSCVYPKGKDYGIAFSAVGEAVLKTIKKWKIIKN
ncbi:MAG: sucrose-6-phosphate hydrolase [Lachnospiraceae bacterium]|jgi:beta-fructofuranosidase|nr:sucrose-6-phosphate hydrolase [Lachnospiraceae bacterium]